MSRDLWSIWGRRRLGCLRPAHGTHTRDAAYGPYHYDAKKG